MRRTILMLAVSLPFGTAWATPWDANLVVDQTVGAESRSLDYSWSAAPATRDGDTFHHYEICVGDGETPTEPDPDSPWCHDVPTRTVTSTSFGKVYAQDAAAQEWLVNYGNDLGWEESTGNIRVCLDTAGNPCRSTSSSCVEITNDCMEDLEYVVDPVGPVDGIFFYARHPGYWSGTTGPSCTSGTDATTPLGIIAAKRDN